MHLVIVEVVKETLKHIIIRRQQILINLLLSAFKGLF